MASAYYLNPTHWIGIFGPLDSNYLNLAGTNKYPSQFQFIPGDANLPGLGIQGDEKSGFYSDLSSTPNLQLSLRGFKSHSWAWDTYTLTNKEGNAITITLPASLSGNFTLTLPQRTSTLMTVDDIITEALSGTVDGVNDVFTTTHTIRSIVDVQVDGVGGEPVASFTGSSVTLTTAPSIGEVPRIIYIRV